MIKHGIVMECFEKKYHIFHTMRYEYELTLRLLAIFISIILGLKWFRKSQSKYDIYMYTMVTVLAFYIGLNLQHR